MSKNFKDFMAEKFKGSNLSMVAVNELAFNETKISKVVELYGRIMGKKMGGKFLSLGVEEYTRKRGRGKGIRTMNNEGQMLRFNWDEKLAKKSSFELTSIDYWAKGNIDFELPTRSVRFGPELNVVQVLGKITDALLTGSIHESLGIIDEANLMLEAAKRNRDEREAWLASKGLPRSIKGSVTVMRRVAKERGFAEELEIFLGEPEKNTFEGEIKEVEKAFDDKHYADPQTVFEDIEDLVGLIATGDWRTLIICGQGGIGKTFEMRVAD